MILRSICLQGWRCFADAIELGPFSDGLNVVHGPNGIGKSTLFEALLRGFVDSHRVKGREIEGLRPWGRSLAPIVSIEFSHDGTDYFMTKGFLEKAQCALRRKEDGRFVPFSEGEKAEQFVQGIVTKNPPQRGLAGREHWGLAQILWAPQGELAIPTISGDLALDIHRVLGVQVGGPGSGRLEKRIATLYDAFYTSTGKLRSGQLAPELVTMRDRLADVQGKREEALERQQEFEELARKLEDLRAQQADAIRTSKELEKRIALIRPKAEEYTKLLSSRSERDEQAKAAEAQHDALRQRMDAIIKTRRDLNDAREARLRIQEELTIREQEARDRRAEAERAMRDLEDTRKERPKVKEAQDETDLARRFLQDVKDASRLKERLKGAKKLGRELDVLKIERGKLLAPDNKTLKAVRTTIKARDEARLRLEAALITIQVVPSKTGSLTILEAEELGTRELIPEEPIEIRGSPQVVVDLAGTARLRAWGPTGSVAELRRVLEQHAQELARLTSPFGTTDPEVLEKLNESASQLDRKIGDLNIQIEAILAGDTLNNLEQQLASVQSAIKQVQQERPGWKRKLPDLLALEESANAIRDKFVTDVEMAEHRRDTAQTSFSSANERRAETAARIAEIDKTIQSLQEALDQLTVDSKTDDQRAKEIAKIALRWEAAKSAFDEVENKLNAFEHDPRADLEQLEGLRRSAEEAVKKALGDEKKEEGRLEQLSALGTYSCLAKIDEEMSSLTDKVMLQQLRANAIKLLYDTVEQCRARALEAVGKPVEQTATRTFQRIAGVRLGNIGLGEYFEPTYVLPQRMNESVPIRNVSGGEKEQIYLATRLALAEVLAREERQLVVLDDALTFTDSLRLGRVLRILEEASEKLQIVVLTCHPERYGALAKATFLDLEAATQRPQTATA